MFQKVLVPLDGSRLAESILPYASALAIPFHSQVYLLHIMEPPAEEVRAAYAHLSLPLDELASATRADAYLATVARGLWDQGAKAKTQVVTGKPAQEILRFVQREGVDLLAMSTHGRSGLNRWAFGSVADWLLRASPVPVLLVRGEERKAGTTSNGLSSILVPLDGSPLAEGVVPLVEALGAGLGLPVRLLQVISETALYPVAWPASEGMYFPDLLADLTEEARRYLGQVAERLRSKGLQVEIVVQPGNPANRIIAAANQRRGSLVVISTRGRSGFQRLVLGSVTDKVVRRSGRPVLVVPPAAAAEQ
ncbi:MAG: universal stress protein [Chloroflexi bacterium]|nr:universal stress protein [Chloroflexota bacterium]